MEMANITSLLAKLVAIESITSKEGKIIDYLYAFLKKQGVSVKRQKVSEGRENLLAVKGSGQKSILLYGHVDTVSVVPGWNSQPLKLKIVADKAYGLGAWDMKGGVVVNILAFLTTELQNYKLKLALGVDEENISLGGYKLARSAFIKDVACVISTEPAFKYGLQGIVIGRAGRAVYKLQIKQPQKHVAFYEPKADINLLLAEILTTIASLYRKIDAEKKQFIFARKIESFSSGMSVPGKVVVELESIILPPLTHESMLLSLKKIIGSVVKKYDPNISYSLDFAKRITPFLNPYQVREENKYLKLLKKSVEKVTARVSKPYFRSSVADENIFGVSGLTTLGIGPCGANAHSANEWVSLESLQKLYFIIQDFLHKIDNEC